MSDQQTSADGFNSDKPGAELRRVRERAGITLQQMSERTKIAVHRLEGLERDDYDAAGGRAFVIGFARACIRVLDVAPQPFIQAFDAALRREDPFDREEVAAQHSPAAVPQPGRHKNLVFVGLVGLTLILLLVWFLLDNDHTSGVEGVAQQSPIADLDQRVEQTLAIDVEDNSDTALEPAVSVSATSEVVPQESLVVEQSQPVPDATGASQPVALEVQPVGANAGKPEEPLSSRTADNDLVQVSVAADSNQTSAEAVNSDPQPAVDSPAKGHSLQLSFSDECWVAVTDATGKSLVAQVAQSGDNLHLFGQAPFDITLGNAHVAQVQLNGEAVPVQPRPGRRVLRLRVGE